MNKNELFTLLERIIQLSSLPPNFHHNLGHTDFSPLVSDLEILSRFTRNIKSCLASSGDLYEQWPALGQQFGQMSDLLEKIRDMWFERSSLDRGNSVIREFRSHLISLLHQFTVIVVNFSDTQEQAKEEVALLKKLRETATIEYGEIGKLVDAARKAASEGVVSQFNNIFNEQADSHQFAGRVWLGFTIIIGAITFIAAACIANASVDSGAGIHWNFLISKVVLLSFLASATYWCGRNYRTQNHLNVVNRHRCNSLRTFELFTRSAADQNIKDTILLESVHSIFSPSVTGYLGAEESTGGDRLIEIIKSVGSKVS